MLEHYLARQPAPDERIEIAVATLCAMFRNANRGEGEQPVQVDDFLPYMNPWAPPKQERYSDVDRSFMAAFGVRAK